MDSMSNAPNSKNAFHSFSNSCPNCLRYCHFFNFYDNLSKVISIKQNKEKIDVLKIKKLYVITLNCWSSDQTQNNSKSYGGMIFFYNNVYLRFSGLSFSVFVVFLGFAMFPYCINQLINDSTKHTLIVLLF